MLQAFKKLFMSRKFLVAVGTSIANAIVAQLNLSPEMAILLMKGLTAVGSVLIGAIAYEDGKTKEFGTSPENKK